MFAARAQTVACTLLFPTPSAAQKPAVVWCVTQVACIDPAWFWQAVFHVAVAAAASCLLLLNQKGSLPCRPVTCVVCVASRHSDPFFLTFSEAQASRPLIVLTPINKDGQVFHPWLMLISEPKIF
jgi:hypothetical protein